MKPDRNLTALIFMFVFLVSGCAIKDSIVTRPMDTPVIMVAPINPRITQAQLKSVVIEACTRYGWKIDSASNTLVQATLNHNRESVTVEIPFSKEKVEIRYKSSTNMRYEGEKIHRSYNRWVKNIEVAIRNGIATK